MDHNFYKVRYQHSKQVWWVNMHILLQISSGIPLQKIIEIGQYLAKFSQK